MENSRASHLWGNFVVTQRVELIITEQMAALFILTAIYACPSKERGWLYLVQGDRARWNLVLACFKIKYYVRFETLFDPCEFFWNCHRLRLWWCATWWIKTRKKSEKRLWTCARALRCRASLEEIIRNRRAYAWSLSSPPVLRQISSFIAFPVCLLERVEFKKKKKHLTLT